MDIEQNKDGWVKVTVDAAKINAYLEVYKPTGQGKGCTFDQAMSALQSHNVVFGIMEDKVQEAVNNYDKALVAQGKMPVDGEPARLEFHFPLPSKKLSPKIDEKGVADYHDLGLINNIRRGELLVTKIRATEGEPGINVAGEPIAPKPGKDIHIPRGKNTVASDDETLLFAANDGHVTLVGGKVVVSPVFQLNGDVDFSSGDIDFVGNVSINGNVTAGFKVRASGDIEVNGFIENSEVVAEGSIQVKGGITGGVKCLVRAGENLQARFAENARIEAGRDIYIREAIMQSQVKAGGSIKVMDKKGIIVGGVIQAGKEVESKVLGSQLATQTIVEVGINPLFRDEYHKIVKHHAEMKKSLDNVSQTINVFQRSGLSMDDLDDKKRQLLLRVLDEYKRLRQEVQEAEQRMFYLEQEHEKSNQGRISVWEIVYPGVRLSIGQTVHIINDPVKFSAFIADKGEIKITSLR